MKKLSAILSVALRGLAQAATNFQKTFNSDLQSFGVMSYDPAKVLLTAMLNAYKAAGHKAPTLNVTRN